MIRRLLALALFALTALPTARAQEASECVPDLDLLVYGPSPDAPPEPSSFRPVVTRTAAEARTATARFAETPADLTRPAVLTHRAAFSNGGSGACATLMRSRFRNDTGTGWEADSYYARATYDDAGQTTSIQARLQLGPDEEAMFDEAYAYDAAGQLVEVQYDATFPDGTQVRNRVALTYGAGRLTRAVTENRVGTRWVPGSRASWTYGDGPYATERVSEDWTGTQWEAFSRETLAYDAAGRRLGAVAYTLNDGGSQPAYRRMWTYSADGTSASVFDESYTDGDTTTPAAWHPQYRGTFAFEQTRLMSALSEYADEDRPGVWIVAGGRTYAYDADSRTTQVLFSNVDETGTLRPLDRLRFVYTTSGLSEGYLAYTDGADGWLEQNRYTLTRDASDRTSELLGAYLGADGTWVIDYSTLYAYDGITAHEGGPDTEARTLSVGPNPTSVSATVRFSLASASAVRLSVVDALGREVLVVSDGEQGAGDHTARLDAARLAPGVYLVRLSAAGRVATQRLTIAR